MIGGLDLLLKDFGDTSRKAFDIRNKKKKIPEDDFEKDLMYSMALDDLKFFDEEGLVWYDGREGYMPEVPIGKPEDYLSIRDDYIALKNFIGRTLDKGKVHAGGGTHGDSSRETNCADYITWLYKNNSNKEFKDAFETGVFALLEDSFKKKYVELDISSSLKKEQDGFKRIYTNIDNWLNSMFSRDNLDGALWRLGLGSNVSEGNEVFKSKFETEVKKTERRITLKEIYNQYSGSKEDLKKSFDEGQFNDTLQSHLIEMPEDFKKEMRDWYINNNAKRDAISKYSPQFNRLVGLLDVVASIGKRNEKFEAYNSFLKQKAEKGFMIDAPTITHYYSGTNIYQNILIALSAVQQGTELQNFWLDNVRKDPSKQRVIASVHGLLNMYDSKEDRKKLIPQILDGLQKRKYDVDKEYQSQSMIGFYSDENLLDNILGHITRLCFSRGTYQHLEKEIPALDILQDKKVIDKSYDFKFVRFTSKSMSELKATFQIADNKIEGDTEVEKTVRAYLNKNGYELLNDVWITSLEGRKITNSETKIVNIEQHNLDGLYEGIIGLNYTHLPFIYDTITDKLLIAEPIESHTILFGVQENWEERRMGLDKITEVIAYSKFQPLNELGERVNQLVVEKKKRGSLADSIYSLKDKLSDELNPQLANVISAVLIKKQDGLVK